MKNRAAYFDIDGTIYREGLISEMFKKMIKFELIDSGKWYNEVKPDYIKWDKRQGGYDSYLQKMVDIYTDTVKNTSSFHINYIANKVVRQNGERIYTFSRERLRWHREQGHKIIAVSGSPIELVREMSELYEMDDYRGTIYQVDGTGIYTGEIIPMWDSASKRRAVLEIAEKYDIDLAESYAYGDTNGDYAMLKLVGNPYVINPTRELLTRIEGDEEMREKINIIVERKDVIYQMNAKTLNLL